MADLPNPHDKFFRALLSDPGRAHDFLRDHLPNSVAGRLTNDPPEIIEGSFVDEALAGSQSDLLLKFRLASGGSAFAYLLAEHKSTPDPGLPLQLASYMVRIWKRHAGAYAERLRALPPIIPVVVYHGDANWTVAGGLGEMIDADDPELEFLPGSRYILRNLRMIDTANLSRNEDLLAGFMTMRREDEPIRPEVAKSLLKGGELSWQMIEYILRVHPLRLEDLKTMLRSAGYNELEAIVDTIAETLLEQGEERGLIKGKANAFLLLARIKFGDLPAARADEVRAADTATLDRWLEALIGADTLDAVFDPPRQH